MNSPSGASVQAFEFLGEVERFANRKFYHPSEIATLIQMAMMYQQRRIFEEIIFLAKFLWNSYNVMQRIGPAGEGYPKLSAEFRDTLEKMTTLIKTLIKEGPEEVKEKFKTLFFSMPHESMNNLLRLIDDLSWVKNYSIDTQRSIV